ncbi:polysaccharide pyruvyl transferase family protein [Leucothrix arctica]|uniref:Polysaccharide pyruvyl transferase family protein n=2 Tax=Leucothrix arctica TaxID=1481894 RepID=A0A317CEB7_9GAMM|nr:polysaccharide pyruvyl transferase family protein [Leucothrix arctica]
MDAVSLELGEMFTNKLKIRFPTHHSMSGSAKKVAWNNELGFVGGTNLLRNYWRNRARKNQWSLSLLDSWRMTPAILMGVGWNVYADEPEFKAKLFYRKALSKHWLHSVRDAYTLEKLKQCGITNVINTGCPTLWRLSPDVLSKIPKTRSTDVVFTLTDYRQDSSLDSVMIAQLLSGYEKVYFWPQGSGDLEYFSALCKSNPSFEAGVTCLGMNLHSFDTFIKNNATDYIGTRLHAGVRALQHSRRSVIISVDNRAEEMGRDFNLPVLKREEVNSLLEHADNVNCSAVSLPHEEIRRWKEQFVNA